MITKTQENKPRCPNKLFILYIVTLICSQIQNVYTFLRSILFFTFAFLQSYNNFLCIEDLKIEFAIQQTYTKVEHATVCVNVLRN